MRFYLETNPVLRLRLRYFFCAVRLSDLNLNLAFGLTGGTQGGRCGFSGRAGGGIADAGCEGDQDAIALLDSLEGLPATTVVLCMEGRAAWRVRLSVAGKDRRVSVRGLGAET
jgi:hypothetical protein